MGVQFKLAQKKDLHPVVDLMNECFQEKTSYDYAQKIFNQTEKDPNQLHLVAISSDHHQIVAYCKVTIIPCISSPMKTYAIINHLCVKPEFRREHIATQLLSQVETITKEHGASSLLAWSKNNRPATHALYEKTGFQVLDAPIFRKELI